MNELLALITCLCVAYIILQLLKAAFYIVVGIIAFIIEVKQEYIWLRRRNRHRQKYNLPKLKKWKYEEGNEWPPIGYSDN